MAPSIEIHESIEPIARSWEELADRTRADPFARPGWVEAWSRAFLKGRLQLVCLSGSDGLLALAPLARQGRLLTSLTNWHTFTPFGFLAVDEEAIAQLSRAVIEQTRARLRLRFLDGSGPTARGMRDAARRIELPTSEREMTHAPYVSLEGTWEEYERGLSRSLRKNLRRRRARLAELGELAFDVSTGTADLQGDLEAGFRLEASGWKGARRTDVGSRPAVREFFVALARWASTQDMLRLSFLRLSGEPIAFDFGIECNGVHYSLRTSYDERHRELGPGAELVRRLIERGFERGLDSFELLAPADRFKASWAGENAREMVELQAFKGPAAPLDRSLHGPARQAARSLQRALRRKRA